jgi:hypothetical protein
MGGMAQVDGFAPTLGVETLVFIPNHLFFAPGNATQLQSTEVFAQGSSLIQGAHHLLIPEMPPDFRHTTTRCSHCQLLAIISGCSPPLFFFSFFFFRINYCAPRGTETHLALREHVHAD